MEENVSPEPASSPGRCLLPYPHRDFNSACLSCRSKCAFRSCSAFRPCRTLFTWTKALLKSTHSRAFWCSFPKGTWFCLCLGQTRSPCITAWTSRSSTPSHAFRPFRACTCAHGLSTKRHAQIFRRLPFRQLGYHAENLNPKRSKFSHREKPQRSRKITKLNSQITTEVSVTLQGVQKLKTQRTECKHCVHRFHLYMKLNTFKVCFQKHIVQTAFKMQSICTLYVL